jgi:hypothetical protein
MAMKETVTSLRAYFILSGLASLFIGLPDLAAHLRAGISPASILAAVFGIVGVCLDLAFLYVGFRLPVLLQSSSHRIVMLLYVATGWAILTSLLGLLNGMHPGTIALLGISLLILWYLLRNVRRLAAEAQSPPMTA